MTLEELTRLPAEKRRRFVNRLSALDRIALLENCARKLHLKIAPLSESIIDGLEPHLDGDAASLKQTQQLLARMQGT